MFSRDHLLLLVPFLAIAILLTSSIANGADAPFRRGDVNDDGSVDISDPIVILGYLFSGASIPTCMDASDSNDDAQVNVGDAIHLLGYIFNNGTPPPAPGPFTCGPDVTDDTLGCYSNSCDSGGDPERIAVGHLLQRIAYGPLPGQIDAVIANGVTETIQQQLSPPPGPDSSPFIGPLEDLYSISIPWAEERFVLHPNGQHQYFLGTEEPPADWAQPGFDDSTWLTGISGFGRGDSDDVTEILEIALGLPSVYTRTIFLSPSSTNPSDLYLKMLYDDGFVAYLNGTEIARSLRTNGLPHLTGNPPPHNQFASQAHEATYAEYFPIPASLLVPGNNVLAIQCHNAANNGDFTLRPTIVSMVPDTNGETRRFFSTSSNLQRVPFIRGIYGEQQLQKVLAEFWENHFTTDEDKVNDFFDGVRNRYGHRVLGTSTGSAKISNTLEFEEYDFFCENALGHFGDLLAYSASSVPMLIYLDNILNFSAQPNENYAREILELHTLGVDNGYTQADIEAVARVFTGWTVTKIPNNLIRPFPEYLTDPITTTHYDLANTSLIEIGDNWQYFKGTTEPSPGTAGEATTQWTMPGFDDTSWLTGATGIGMGDGDDATVLDDMDNNYASFYARTQFPITDPASPNYLELSVDFDDGYVCYLNGIEIARSSTMNGAGTPPPHTSGTSGGHEAQGRPDLINLNHYRHLLVTGENVLAFQIHNQTITNNDCSFLPRLTLGTPTNRFTHLNDRQGKFTFRFNPSQHDTEAKIIFEGTPYQLNIPAGRTGTQGILDARDLFAALEAHPGTAQFICIKLIQKFVSDDINLANIGDGSAPIELQSLLASMLSAWYSTPKPGNISVLMETLLDPVERSGPFWSTSNQKIKVKTPLEFINSTLRTLGSPASSDNLVAWSEDMGMKLFERDEPDGFSEVGSDWIGTTTLLQRINFARRFASNVDNDFPWNIADFIGNDAPDAIGVVDIFDEVLFQGAMTEAERCLALEYLETDLNGVFMPLDPAAGDYANRIREVVGFLFSLPRFQFQ